MDSGERRADDDRIRGYACQAVAACLPDRITGVAPAGVGENHAVHTVSYLDDDGSARHVVVRIATTERARDPVVAGREAAVLRRLHGVAAPLLHDFRQTSEWFEAPVMCMDRVEGEQRPPRDGQDFERLGRVVAEVHALPVADLAEHFPVVGTTRDYLDSRLVKVAERARGVRDPLPPAVQDRLRRALAGLDEIVESARTARSFDTDDPLVLLHGDVAGGNIVWTSSPVLVDCPVLIDWEYARVGDPADEIAYVFAQHDCTDEHRSRFWDGYQGRSGESRSLEQVRDRVLWWEPVTVLGSALFWVELWSLRLQADAAGHHDPRAPKEQDHYGAQALLRLDRFEALVDRRGGPWRTGTVPSRAAAPPLRRAAGDTVDPCPGA